MKSPVIFAALAVALAGLAASPALAGPGHDGHGKAAAAKTADTFGVIQGLDEGAATVTIAHDAIAGLKWPARVTTFPVQSAAVLNGVTVGRKVHFIMISDGDKTTVTQIHVL